MVKLGDLPKEKLIQLLPDTVNVLPPTPGLRAIHTTLRDKKTAPDAFRHAVLRVGRLLVSTALGLIMAENEEKRKAMQASANTGMVATSRSESTHSTIEPPTIDSSMESTDGCTMPDVCCVSIVRGGQSMEKALKECIPDVRIGKIIIEQTKHKQQGPRLYYCKFPKQITTSTVILVDPVLATANTIEMALNVLLEHKVREENIVIVTVLSAPQGLYALSKVFPKVRIVSSWIDSGLDERFFVTPGIGAFGARYFNCGDKATGRVLPRVKTEAKSM